MQTAPDFVMFYSAPKHAASSEKCTFFQGRGSSGGRGIPSPHPTPRPKPSPLDPFLRKVVYVDLYSALSWLISKALR